MALPSDAMPKYAAPLPSLARQSFIPGQQSENLVIPTAMSSLFLRIIRPSWSAASTLPPGELTMIGSLRRPSFFNMRLSWAGVPASMAPSAEIHSGQLGSQPVALLRTTAKRIGEISSDHTFGSVQVVRSDHFGKTSSAFAAKAAIAIATTGTRRTSPRHHPALLLKRRPRTTLGKSPLNATYNSCGGGACNSFETTAQDCSACSQ
ncbi:hypothetical protein [Mesorhizobium sp.]|uniref:hypothetical protein n=1 Tax=Mesorhizobium sp. TaxID=1871066 RepID=UPI002579E319|nr:hypothetical protein [Mesorhizobium sp.]